MEDWGKGRYEQTASELEPVAEAVVRLAAPMAGARLLDVACGTGNAALLAAGRGADVVGVDSSERLLAVARQRAAAAGLLPEFLMGDALALPVADASFDMVVSVFGVIFASDPAKAISEISRVLTSEGRAYVTAWVPAGPINAMLTVFRRAVGRATGASPPAAVRRPHRRACRRPTAAAPASIRRRLRRCVLASLSVAAHSAAARSTRFAPAPPLAAAVAPAGLA